MVKVYQVGNESELKFQTVNIVRWKVSKYELQSTHVPMCTVSMYVCILHNVRIYMYVNHELYHSTQWSTIYCTQCTVSFYELQNKHIFKLNNRWLGRLKVHAINIDGLQKDFILCYVQIKWELTLAV